MGFGNSVLVMQVTQVISGDALAEDDGFNGFTEQLSAAFSDDMMVQYINAIRTDLGVQINDRAVAYVIGGEGQAGGGSY